MSMTRFRIPGKAGFHSAEAIQRHKKKQESNIDKTKEVMKKLSDAEDIARNKFIEEIEALFETQKSKFVPAQYDIVTQTLKAFKTPDKKEIKEDVSLMGGYFVKAPGEEKEFEIKIPKNVASKSQEVQDQFVELSKKYIEKTGLMPHPRAGINGLIKELAKVGVIVQNDKEGKEIVDDELNNNKTDV